MSVSLADPSQARTLHSGYTKVLTAVLVLVVVGALYFCASIYVTVEDGVELTGHVLGRDFVNYWMGGQAIADGWVLELFDEQQYLVRLREVFGAGYPAHNWSYPPHYLLLAAPLGLFGYLAAFALWNGAGLAAYGASLRSLALALPVWLIVLACLPVVLTNVFFGQNGMFTAALMLAGLGLRDRRPWLAGILIGCLTIKPQLGVLIPFLLVIQQNWKTIAAAALTSVALVAASVLAFGWESWVAYIEITAPYQTRIMTEAPGIFIAMAPTAFMAARELDHSIATAFLVQLPLSAIAICAALVTAWVTRREPDRRGASAVLIVATFVAMPYVLNYDMTAAVGAVLLWLSLQRGSFSLWRALLIALTLALPVIGAPAAMIGFPIGWAVMLAALCVMTHDVCLGLWPWSRASTAAELSPAPR